MTKYLIVFLLAAAGTASAQSLQDYKSDGKPIDSAAQVSINSYFHDRDVTQTREDIIREQKALYGFQHYKIIKSHGHQYVEFHDREGNVAKRGLTQTGIGSFGDSSDDTDTPAKIKAKCAELAKQSKAKLAALKKQYNRLLAAE